MAARRGNFLATSALSTATRVGTGGSTTKIVIGRKTPGHVIFEVGGKLLQGGGTQEEGMMVGEMGEGFKPLLATGPWKRRVSFRLPILNANGVSAIDQTASNRVDAAAKALWRGYRF